jgi:hypothetical protein
MTLKFSPLRALVSIACVGLFFAIFTNDLNAATLHGSIHLSGDAFSLKARYIENEFAVSLNNSTDFALSTAMASGDSFITLINPEGKSISKVEYGSNIRSSGKVLEQNTEQVLRIFTAKPQNVEWRAQRDETKKYPKYTYNSWLSPERISFEPPVEIEVFDKYTGATLKSYSVGQIRFTGSMTIVLKCGQIGISAPYVTLEIEKGLTADDKFLLALESKAIPAPRIGAGKNIGIVSLPSSGESVQVRLYRPSGSEHHVFAFFPDIEGRKAFKINALSIDGEQLLKAEAHSKASRIIHVEKGLLYPLWSIASEKEVPLDIGFNEDDFIAYGFSVRSLNPEFLMLRENRLPAIASGVPGISEFSGYFKKTFDERPFVLAELESLDAWDFATTEDVSELLKLGKLNESLSRAAKLMFEKTIQTPEIKHRVVQSKNPPKFTALLHIPKDWSLGSHEGAILIESVNTGRREIPVKVEITDSLAFLKSGFTGAFGAVFSGYIVWLLLERKKKGAETALKQEEDRLAFIQENYSVIRELNDKIEALSFAPDESWSNIESILTWFYSNKLQKGFSRSAWLDFQRAAVARDQTAMLVLMKREIIGAFGDVKTTTTIS